MNPMQAFGFKNISKALFKEAIAKTKGKQQPNTQKTNDIVLEKIKTQQEETTKSVKESSPKFKELKRKIKNKIPLLKGGAPKITKIYKEKANSTVKESVIDLTSGYVSPVSSNNSMRINSFNHIKFIGLEKEEGELHENVLKEIKNGDSAAAAKLLSDYLAKNQLSSSTLNVINALIENLNDYTNDELVRLSDALLKHELHFAAAAFDTLRGNGNWLKPLKLILNRTIPSSTLGKAIQKTIFSIENSVKEIKKIENNEKLSNETKRNLKDDIANKTGKEIFRDLFEEIGKGLDSLPNDAMKVLKLIKENINEKVKTENKEPSKNVDPRQQALEKNGSYFAVNTLFLRYIIPSVAALNNNGYNYPVAQKDLPNFMGPASLIMRPIQNIVNQPFSELSEEEILTYFTPLLEKIS